MHPFDLLLLLSTLVALVWPLLPSRFRPGRWLRLLPSLNLLDGRTIAHHVQADGPAARTDMAWGAQILAWNGQPVEQAAQQVLTLWASVAPATYAG